MKSKDNWIESIINTTVEINTVKMPFDLSKKITEKINGFNAGVLIINPKIKWSMAAAIALLISLNTIIILQYKKSVSENKLETSTFQKKYFDYTEQF